MIVQSAGPTRVTASPEDGIGSTARAIATGIWKKYCFSESLDRCLVFMPPLPSIPAEKLAQGPAMLLGGAWQKYAYTKQELRHVDYMKKKYVYLVIDKTYNHLRMSHYLMEDSCLFDQEN